MIVAESAIDNGYHAAIYMLNVRPNARLKARAEEARVPLRRYAVFHELLTDLLQEAGLPGPLGELDRMASDRERPSLIGEARHLKETVWNKSD